MVTSRIPKAFTVASLLILAVSLALTRDRFTWVLEVAPILIGLPILLITYKKFQFTGLVYGFLILHFIILSVGGIYTYAEVPLGYWMQDWFGFQRNHYDRIGHFVQGFIPALILRELLIRTSSLKPGKWMFALIIGFCLGVSAFYELIEWWTAASQGADANAFLGSQGDIWDAQWDMFLCLIGATVSMIALPKIHDRFLAAKIG